MMSEAASVEEQARALMAEAAALEEQNRLLEAQSGVRTIPTTSQPETRSHHDAQTHQQNRNPSAQHAPQNHAPTNHTSNNGTQHTDTPQLQLKSKPASIVRRCTTTQNGALLKLQHRSGLYQQTILMLHTDNSKTGGSSMSSQLGVAFSSCWPP